MVSSGGLFRDPDASGPSLRMGGFDYASRIQRGWIVTPGGESMPPVVVAPADSLARINRIRRGLQQLSLENSS